MTMQPDLISSPDGARLRRRRLSCGVGLVLAASLFAGAYSGKLSDASAQPVAPPLAAEPRPVAVARGVVEVEGGLLDLSWDGPGKVSRVFVREGQAVSAGMPIIEIDRVQQGHEKDIARHAERQAELAVQALAGQLPPERAREARVREAVRLGGVAEQQLADVRRAVKDLESQVRVAQAAHGQAVARLKLAEWEYERRLLRAPVDTTVLRVHTRSGSATTAHPVLVSLLPQGQRMVRAEFSAYYADQLRPGLKARFERTAVAAPASVEGEVVQVSDTFSESRFGSEGMGIAGGRVIEVRVALPEHADLRVGEIVTVNAYDRQK